MTAGSMQPYFFPYLGYFQLIQAVDAFIFLDDVDFIKRGWINRNRILLDGDGHMLSVPLIKASQNRPINSIELGFDRKWLDDFYAKLEHAYKKAPHYQSVMKLVEEVMESGAQRIDELTIASVRAVCRYLELDTRLHRSSVLDPSKSGKAHERILRLCEELGADRYINPFNGRHLYRADDFSQAGLELRFLKKKEGLHYPQFKSSNFVDNLSILDVLMFNDEEEVRRLLDRYELIEPEA